MEPKHKVLGGDSGVVEDPSLLESDTVLLAM
jgi:hypothetical protein